MKKNKFSETRDAFFETDEAEDLYEDLQKHMNLESKLEDYFDYIEDLVDRKLIDKRLLDPVEKLINDFYVMDDWFRRYLK
tara:strand:+ start:1956 stop:2195 length:240 start_codon:yes stop_codon:yes gene_type:complete